MVILSPNQKKEPAIMTEKDPALWAALLQWATENSVQIWAPLLSVGIASLRVIYGGGQGRQVVLEGALCGLATLCIVPALQWFGLPESMATFVGGTVGFVGVDKLRDYADKFIGHKVDK